MALWSAFYDALNNDRVYNADEFCSVFDGFVEDGVFPSKDNVPPFRVTAGGNLKVTIGKGCAWFANRFIKNDGNVQFTMPAASTANPRYDALCIKVDKSDSVRAASFAVVQGTAAASPTKPTPTNTSQVTYHVIAYIYRTTSQSAISNDNITSNVGTSSTPYASTVTDVGSDLVENAVKTAIPNEYGRREIIIIADSYGDPTSSGDAGNAKTFIDYINELAGSYSKWSIHSKYQGGASFLGLDNNTNLKFINVLRNVTGITDASKITDIVVVGGDNEVTNLDTDTSTNGGKAAGFNKTTTQVRTAIREFVTYCHTTYPNANVMLCPVGKQRFNYFESVLEAYKKMIQCWTDPYLAGCIFTPMKDADCVMIRENYFKSGDNWHPSNAGGQAIASSVISALLGESAGLYDFGNGYLVKSSLAPGALTSVTSNTLRLIRARRNVSYQMRTPMGLQFNTTSGYAFAGYPEDDNGIRVCQLGGENYPFLAGSDRNLRATIPMVAQLTDNSWIDVTGTVWLFGKELWIRPHIFKAGEGWPKNPVAIKYIGIPPFTITGDAGLCCI